MLCFFKSIFVLALLERGVIMSVLYTGSKWSARIASVHYIVMDYIPVKIWSFLGSFFIENEILKMVS